MRPKLKRRRIEARRGVETVELAVVLPLLILLTFGTLEICEGILLRQKVEIAAHEGARAAIQRNANTSRVERAVAQYLDARGIQYDDISAVVTVPPPNSVAVLEPIPVSVTIDTATNLRLPLPIYRYWAGRQISAEVVMLKEFIRQ